MIKFGTDGWRGLIARDFTFDNVRLVALATANIVNKIKKGGKVVIGYDTRFLGKEFALETAQVLAWQGIKVMLADDVASTPQVSYHTKVQEADLGVVITASHNPAIYNGYKLKSSFGGPAAPEQVTDLETELAKIWDNPPEFSMQPVDEYIESGQIDLFNAKKTYLSYLNGKIDFNAINKAGFKVVFDPMYGAGIDTIKYVLPNAEEIHAEYNPGFGEVDHPEPIGSCLPQLMDKIKNGNYDVGLATDGDADRLGAVDNEGNYVDAHRVFMILLKYLYEVKGLKGAVVKTVSLTSMVDKYCEAKGIELHETPVGFKYTAKKMAESNVLIGGEESGGLGTSLHIPERDGLFNGFLLLEAMAKWGKSLKELSDGLDEELGVHRFRRNDVRVSQEQKDTILNACAKIPEKIGDMKVISTNTRDGYKFFVDGGWLLVRASGTEPLLRFYSEADSMQKVDYLLEQAMNIK